MFTEFFYLLRGKGLDVSTKEWLTLQRALELNLHYSSLNGLFLLGRSILCKSETEYDKYEEVFLKYFKDVYRYYDETKQQEVPEWLMDVLNHPGRRQAKLIRYTKEDITEEMKSWSREEIERKLKKKLEDQKKESNGGKMFVGTHGISPYGNAGFNENAIRVGGRGQNSTALHVAGNRSFRDFREDNVLSIRQFQMAFRRLCQYSEQHGVAEELDVNRTIQETCKKGGILDIQFKKTRENTIKVLLLIDSGGSMGPYGKLCSKIFQAASQSNRFKDLKVYYFHNCINEYLYTSPTLESRYAKETLQVFKECDKEYKAIVVGDASMDMTDLTYRPSPVTRTNRGYSGEEWLKAFQKQYPYNVWMTPFVRSEEMLFGPWGETYQVIKSMFDFYPLTLEGLEMALQKLMVNH